MTEPKKWVVPMICAKCEQACVSGGWYPTGIEDQAWVKSSCCEEYELYVWGITNELKL